jgi:glycosyltransferase involved in cell wall biosynthesis
LPSIREILNEENAVFCKADDSEALAAGVGSLLADPTRSLQLSERAVRDVQGYTWLRRAEKIKEFLCSTF